MTRTDLYQSVLRKLSLLPASYLEDIDQYLSELSKKVKPENSDTAKIMSFAGAWSDMDDEDFESFMLDIKENRKNLFNRPIEE
jgi:hypothetical protein